MFAYSVHEAKARTQSAASASLFTQGVVLERSKIKLFHTGGGVGGGAHPSRGAGPTNVSLIISVIFSLLFCNSSQKYL